MISITDKNGKTLQVEMVEDDCVVSVRTAKGFVSGRVDVTTVKLIPFSKKLSKMLGIKPEAAKAQKAKEADPVAQGPVDRVFV